MRARTMPFSAGWRRLAAILVLLAAAVAGQAAQARTNIAAELVAESAAVPGETLELALHFRPDPGWHGYWANPGDAGYGMVLDWRLPAGWQAGEPEYPVPQTLLIGELMNHVYEADYAVLVPVEVPKGAAAGTRVPIAVAAQWLACTDKICVPEAATLRLQVAIGQPRERDRRFDGWRRAIPPLLDSGARAELGSEALRIAIPLPVRVAMADPHVFVEADRLVDYAAPQRFLREGDAVIAEIPLARGGVPLPAEIRGVLKLNETGDGVRFVARPGPVPESGMPVRAGGDGAPMLALLLGAFFGGLLLNVLPCVFPILSLKALSLARAGETAAQARREGLAYTAGVVLACLALGALLLALREAGQQVGWAFQLQEPGVVVGLLLLATAITANLAGLYHLPALSLTRAGEPAGAFATGLLAAFVATPCTGPFMAAALGAALLLPAVEALALFAALGLGLAFPFLMLGLVPACRRILPRPGPWMERFRMAMAVPMGLTALALLWLASRLGGAGFALVAAIALFGLVVALWAAGRRQRGGRPAWALFALIAAPFALFAALALPAAYGPAARGEAGILAPEPFGEAALAKARASGRPVFVWFTADWCVTCKVNEQVAIEREATRAAFERAGVIAIRGDWTRRDPAITRFLAGHGAAGVPLYLWYPPGGPAEKLPQVLGPDSLIELARRSRGNAPAARPEAPNRPD